MKKTTLLITLFLAVNSLIFAQCPGGSPAPGYTCIPDANFENALFLLGIDSVNGDFRILNSEASIGGFLDVSGNNISDMTGIEAFVNITSLKASGNPFTTINLSSNTALVDLNINSTGISSVDVSSLVSLDKINVSYCANLTSLDLTSNTIITDVNLQANSAVTSINLTGLTTITSLDLFDNDLSVLDVSLNTLLNDLNVRNNQISVLDLSSNGALTSLDCRGNDMTSLDMRNGNNANVVLFNSDFNNNLTCIFVDDASASYLTTLPWSKDALSSFVNDEAECSTLNIEDMNSNTFNIYPNPAKNSISISSNINSSLVEVYSITGKLLMSKDLEFGENRVDISSLSAGVYLARFSHEEQSITKKLIVD